MGRRGPQPEPTRLKIAKGNPGKRLLNKREPKPDTAMPTCPSWLTKEAKVCWKELAPQLKAMGVLTKIDRQALTNYCQTWARWKAAEQFIQQHGESYPLKDENGKLKYLQQFPQVSISRNLLSSLLRYQREFGLTPSGRVSLQATQAETPADKMRAFLEA